MLMTVKARMQDLGIELAVDDSALNALADKGFDPVYGARPLRRAIQSTVEDRAAELILDGKARGGDKLVATAENGEIVVRKDEESRE